MTFHGAGWRQALLAAEDKPRLTWSLLKRALSYGLPYRGKIVILLDDRGQLIPTIKADSAKMMVDYSVVRGGMLPKLQSAVDAVTAGVGKVVIAGPKFHTEALLHGEGGTHLVAA